MFNKSNLPDNLKEKYKTVWEMSMKDIIDMAAKRRLHLSKPKPQSGLKIPHTKSLQCTFTRGVKD